METLHSADDELDRLRAWRDHGRRGIQIQELEGVFLCGVPSVSRRSRSMPSAGIFPDRAAVAANLRKNPPPIFSPVDGLPGELRSGTPSPNATRALLPTIACWRLRALSVQRAGQRARCCCFGAARTNRPRLRRRRHRRQNAGCIAVSHLDRRLERRTGSCKTVAHGFAEARSALEPDEGQAGKVGRGDDWLFGERMLMRQHADHLAGVNHFMGDARGDASGRARSRARRRGSARLR
jgi:hypothetical protein